jgi:hypothetical protein
MVASRVDGGFESLSHHIINIVSVLLPEALEGNNRTGTRKQMVASRASATI